MPMKHVLVIDDEDGIRRALRTVLERAGYRVREARSGLDALQLWHEEGSDLVITDIHMPGMDGLDTIRELHALSPDLPVIAVSGSGEMASRDLLDDAGLSGSIRTLDKPFKLAEVANASGRRSNQLSRGRAAPKSPSQELLCHQDQRSTLPLQPNPEPFQARAGKARAVSRALRARADLPAVQDRGGHRAPAAAARQRTGPCSHTGVQSCRGTLPGHLWARIRAVRSATKPVLRVAMQDREDVSTLRQLQRGVSGRGNVRSWCKTAPSISGRRLLEIGEPRLKETAALQIRRLCGGWPPSLVRRTGRMPPPALS